MVCFINGLFNGVRNKNALYKETTAELQLTPSRMMKTFSPQKRFARVVDFLFALFSCFCHSRHHQVNALIRCRVDINFNLTFFYELRGHVLQPSRDMAGLRFMALPLSRLVQLLLDDFLL